MQCFYLSILRVSTISIIVDINMILIEIKITIMISLMVVLIVQTTNTSL